MNLKLRVEITEDCSSDLIPSPSGEGRGDPAPMYTNIGTNYRVFQISIHQRNELVR